MELQFCWFAWGGWEVSGALHGSELFLLHSQGWKAELNEHVWVLCSSLVPQSCWVTQEQCVGGLCAVTPQLCPAHRGCVHMDSEPAVSAAGAHSSELCGSLLQSLLWLKPPMVLCSHLWALLQLQCHWTLEEQRGGAPGEAVFLFKSLTAFCKPQKACWWHSSCLKTYGLTLLFTVLKLVLRSQMNPFHCHFLLNHPCWPFLFHWLCPIATPNQLYHSTVQISQHRHNHPAPQLHKAMSSFQKLKMNLNVGDSFVIWFPFILWGFFSCKARKVCKLNDKNSLPLTGLAIITKPGQKVCT